MVPEVPKPYFYGPFMEKKEKKIMAAERRAATEKRQESAKGPGNMGQSTNREETENEPMQFFFPPPLRKRQVHPVSASFLISRRIATNA